MYVLFLIKLAMQGGVNTLKISGAWGVNVKGKNTPETG